MTQRFLIVGDGNFSFSRSVVEDKSFFFSKHLQYEDCIDWTNNENYSQVLIYATSYDSEESIQNNQISYDNTKALKEIAGVNVLHSVDATDVGASFEENTKFSKVIFIFPHVGGKSNIKACRSLLERFFSSIKYFIDDAGKVFVTLCKGQGGIPLDACRNGYGNSWQIATQAAKAGFILSDVIPFESIAPLGYISAGYRGNLEKGFVKKGSLTYVFTRGQEIQLQKQIKFDSRRSLISITDSFYSNKLRKMQRFLPLSECTSYLWMVFQTIYGNDEILDRNGTKFKFCGEYDNLFIKSTDEFEVFKHLPDSNGRCHPLIQSNVFIDSTTEVHPYSYPIKPEAVLLDSTNFSSLHEFATKIHSAMQNVFQNCIFSLSFKESSRKSSILFPSIAFQTEKQTNVYDSQTIPYFLADLDMHSWLTSVAEVTISQDDKMNFDPKQQLNSKETRQLKYSKVGFDEYQMSERERDYFDRMKCKDLSFYSSFHPETQFYNIELSNIVIASIGVYKQRRASKHSKEDPPYVAVFRPDLLCMGLLQLDDIRLLWSEDSKLQSHMKQCLANQITPLPKVKYPLCYRHDLCFWVKEAEYEDILVAAIRQCCQDMVHSVRLLRILRHEESGMLSYCYRMIYSRCDGPLSHKETVDLQNHLRLLLIDLQFDLR